MNRRYAVAVTMTKNIPTGFNIITRLMLVDKDSEDAAVGAAITEAMRENPEHEVFNVVNAPIPEATHDRG